MNYHKQQQLIPLIIQQIKHNHDELIRKSILELEEGNQKMNERLDVGSVEKSKIIVESNVIRSIFELIEPLSFEARLRVLSYVKEFIYHNNETNVKYSQMAQPVDTMAEFVERNRNL